MTHNNALKTLGGIGLLAVVFVTAALLTIAATGGVQAAEVANESVELNDSDELEVTIEWTDTADAANTSTITIANETATVNTTTVDADPGNETTTAWLVPDDLEAGNYTVTVDTDVAGDVNATYVDVFSESDDGGAIFPGLTGDVDPLVAFGGLALLVGGVYYAREEGWL